MAGFITRLCCRCKKNLPIDDFYYRRDRDSYTSKCKGCFSEYQKEYKARPGIRERDRPKRAAWQKQVAARGRDSLSDLYIKKLLTQNTFISYSNLPTALIEAKRVFIQIKRFAEKEK